MVPTFSKKAGNVCIDAFHRHVDEHVDKAKALLSLGWIWAVYHGNNRLFKDQLGHRMDFHERQAGDRGLGCEA